MEFVVKYLEESEAGLIEGHQSLITRAVVRYRPDIPPPNWSVQEWRTELYQEAQVAFWEAVNDFDPAQGVDFEQFVYWRMCSRLKTFVRREWRYQQTVSHEDEQLVFDLPGSRDDSSAQAQSEASFACLLVEQLAGSLSGSERQLWRWVAEGRSFRWIGAQLGISHTLARRRWQKLRERLRALCDAASN